MDMSDLNVIRVFTENILFLQPHVNEYVWWVNFKTIYSNNPLAVRLAETEMQKIVDIVSNFLFQQIYLQRNED
jgi:hypothetical protein